ncbi:MAG: GGDEF domain-containing protein [Anaerolineales bacterium]|nr:GGDEF domain-containing protein [Anaerolineales bacterium]
MPGKFSSLNFLSEKRKRLLYLAALLLGLPAVLLTWRRYGQEFPFMNWSYPVLASLIILWAAMVLVRRIPIRWTEYFVQTTLSLFYLGKYVFLLIVQDVDRTFLLNELHAVFWAIAFLFVLGYILADHTLALLMALGYSALTLALALWLLYPERYDVFLEVFRLQNRVAMIALLTFILAGIKDDLRRAERQATLLQIAANTDSLTGLPNRRMLSELLEDQLRRRALFCVLLADIDHFKTINDSYGHDRGDEVLRRVAEALRVHARETDIVGRWGGEEFLILLSLQDARDGAETAERLRAQVETLRPAGLPVSISLGGTSSRAGDTLASLVKRADQALYEAKTTGRNRVCWQE